MEILQHYEFRRPSRSQYVEVVKAIVDQGAPVVKIKRGEDFPRDAKMASVQGSVSTQIREYAERQGKTVRPRTFVESDDVLVVSTYAEGQGPAKRGARKRPARQPVAA